MMTGSLGLRLERLHAREGLHLCIMRMLEPRTGNKAVAWSRSVDHCHVHRVVVLLRRRRTERRVDQLAMRVEASNPASVLEQKLEISPDIVAG